MKAPTVGVFLGVELQASWATLSRRWLVLVREEEFDSVNLWCREREVWTKLSA